MRKLNFTIVLFAMMMLVIGCGGQKEKAVVEDIVAAAPEMTSVVFENDFVKAVEFTLKPGETLPLHKGGKRAIYSLSDYKIKWTEGKEVTEKEWTKGEAHWHYAVDHAVENIGDTDARFLVVTRKDLALPAAEGYDISQDASYLDTDHSENFFENDYVRLIEVNIPVGEAQPMHQGVNRLIYSLTPYTIKYTSNKMETKEATMEAGAAHWHTADEHAVENISETEAHYVIFEFKK
jgi:quercetin dioxygenase-like cupin family protein